jgi:transcriptional regulator with XRE-family HTH domain
MVPAAAPTHSESDPAPHPVDPYVGGRIRSRRAELGMSQGALARRIGVSFQAVQKYERGHIRLSASRLYDIAQALQVSPTYFFAGYPDGPAAGAVTEAAMAPPEQLGQREILSLVRGYTGIRDPQLQADLLRLIKTLGRRDGDPEAAPDV